MPTKEQIERFIKAADVELGPECQDDWVEECRKILRGGDVDGRLQAIAGKLNGIANAMASRVVINADDIAYWRRNIEEAYDLARDGSDNSPRSEK